MNISRTYNKITKNKFKISDPAALKVYHRRPAVQVSYPHCRRPVQQVEEAAPWAELSPLAIATPAVAPGD